MSVEIYVINISNVGHGWIDNPNTVVQKIREFQEYNEFNIREISTLEELDNIVRNPTDNLIILNAHGETIPMPTTWDSNWAEYIRQISENIKNNNWVFVSITGMPFWYWARDENDNEIQFEGINTLLSSINNRIENRLLFGWSNITQFGRNIAALFGFELPETMFVDRLLEFSDMSSVTKSMYGIGSLSGISAIKMGGGYFIHSGLMTTPPQFLGRYRILNNDEYKALISISFTLGLIRSNRTAEQIYEQYKDNENLLRRNIIMPLLRVKGFKQVTDVHGIDEHGRDVICHMNDNFENRINIGIQIKATRIHSNKSQRNNITEILTQINEAFIVAFTDTFSNVNRKIHKMYVITSKHITSPAKSVISADYDHKRYVHFMEGDHLKEEWITHYSI